MLLTFRTGKPAIRIFTSSSVCCAFSGLRVSTILVHTCLLIWFGCILYSQTFSIWKFYFLKIINISSHVLQFICFPGQNKPSSGVLMTTVSLATSWFLYCALCSLDTEFSAVLSKVCIATAKNKHLPFHCAFYLHLSVNRFAVGYVH